LLMIQSASPRGVSKSNFESRIQRKGNSLNYTVHVHKESGVTHETNLTMFSCKRRVFCSPSMDKLKFDPSETARLKQWIETMDKGATLYVSYVVMDL
jgi:hypothetical protein